MVIEGQAAVLRISCKLTEFPLAAVVEAALLMGGGGGGWGGRVLPCKRLMRMCCWMGSHFHDWIDYNGVTFLVELQEWDGTFSGFLG